MGPFCKDQSCAAKATGWSEDGDKIQAGGKKRMSRVIFLNSNMNREALVLRRRMGNLEILEDDGDDDGIGHWRNIGNDLGEAHLRGLHPDVEPVVQIIQYEYMTSREQDEGFQEVGAGDCILPPTMEAIERTVETDEPSTFTRIMLLKTKWIYYALFFSLFLAVINLDSSSFDESDVSVDVPILEQMVRSNERRYELVHNLNMIHSVLKRCAYEKSNKDEVGKMLSLLYALYESHIKDIEDFMKKVPKCCGKFRKLNDSIENQ